MDLETIAVNPEFLLKEELKSELQLRKLDDHGAVLVLKAS